VVWARHLGLLVEVLGVGRGWLFLQRSGKGYYSLWLYRHSSHASRRVLKYVCYVPKRLAEAILRADIEGARELALDLLHEKYSPLCVLKRRPIIGDNVRMKRLGYRRVNGCYGQLILYRRRKGDWALYLARPRERWRYIAYIPVEYVPLYLNDNDADVEMVTDAIMSLVETLRKKPPTHHIPPRESSREERPEEDNSY